MTPATASAIRAAAAAFGEAIVEALAADAPAADTPDQLLSINEAAAVIRVGRSLLYTLIADGEIKPIKVGRRTVIPAGEIRRYVARQEAGR